MQDRQVFPYVALVAADDLAQLVDPRLTPLAQELQHHVDHEWLAATRPELPAGRRRRFLAFAEGLHVACRHDPAVTVPPSR